MGLFSKLKEQYEAVQAEAAAMSGVDTTPAMPAFIAPRSQEEVDRLLASSGTIRAIALGKRHQVLQPGETVGRMKVEVRLRPRGPEGTLGDEVMLKASVSSWVATLIQPGLDIPVERDPATGRLIQIASKQLTEELQSRKAEADAIRPAWGLDPDVQAAIDLPADIRKALKRKPEAATPAGSAPQPTARPRPVGPPASAHGSRPEPVSGVSWQAYVAVTAYLDAHPAQSAPEADAAASLYGVIPGTWAAVHAAWEQRIAAESGLDELFAWDVAEARKALG